MDFGHTLLLVLDARFWMLCLLSAMAFHLPDFGSTYFSGYHLECWLLNMDGPKRAAEVQMIGRRVKSKTHPEDVFVHPTMELMQDGFASIHGPPVFLNVVP